MAEPQRLTLLAADFSDLPPLSALVQDAIVRAGDVVWDRRSRRLVLIASRYRWEIGDKTRVRAALRVESVIMVQQIGWPRDADAILDLLAIARVEDTIVLTFAGATSLRAEVECVDLVLEDLSSGWDVRHIPRHD